MEPALRKLAGHTDLEPHKVRVVLSGPVRNRGDRRSYLPARLQRTSDELLAEPLPYHGSGDLMAVTRANAMIQLEAGVGEVPAGTEVPALLLEG